jgi:hypothetical protein
MRFFATLLGPPKAAMTSRHGRPPDVLSGGRGRGGHRGCRELEVEVGDPDPLQAIEDALRAFPADELILVTGPGSEAAWLDKERARERLARLGLPPARRALLP